MSLKTLQIVVQITVSVFEDYVPLNSITWESDGKGSLVKLPFLDFWRKSTQQCSPV